MTSNAIRGRMVLVALVLAGVFAVTAVRLAYLHLGLVKVVQPPKPYSLELVAKRGTVYDRSGFNNELAAVLPLDLCFLDSKYTAPENRQPVAQKLSVILQRDLAEMQRMMAQTNNAFMPLCVVTNDSLRRTIESDSLLRHSVGFQKVYRRHYPLGSELAHVLGYVNRAGVGMSGVEALFNRYLTGTDGLIKGQADATRRELLERRVVDIPARDGHNIELTIDQNIQHHTEVALDRAMQEHSATAAWAVVTDCRTGEVLAMATRPGVDRSSYPSSIKEMENWRNRVIAVNFEPGSTLKALTIGAAINEGLVTPQTIFDCENGGWYYAKRVLRDKVRGRQPVSTIIQKSSNIGTAKIALLLGNQRLYSYFRRAGFGQPSGIDLPGEERGILESASTWPQIKITRVAIGQGVSVTALQMAALYGAIANGGQRMKPIILKRVTTADGELLIEREPVPLPAGEPLFSPATAAQLRVMLETVTHPGGTGTRAAVPGYRVAGKTGTAQMAVRGGYSETDFIASFAGFLPADNPEVVIVVVVERPQPLHGGGTVAAPVFAEIALQTARYLNITPTEVIHEKVPMLDATGLWDDEWEDNLP